MPESATRLPDARLWYNELNQHEAQAADIVRLERYIEFITRLGNLIAGNPRSDDSAGLKLFTVYGSYPYDSLPTPLLGYSGRGFEMRTLQQRSGYCWLSIKVASSRRPAYPRLANLDVKATPLSAVGGIDNLLPPDWTFEHFGDNPDQFTLWLDHDHWLFTAVYLLLDELSQYAPS